jgi:hypothetical protein
MPDLVDEFHLALLDLAIQALRVVHLALGFLFKLICPERHRGVSFCRSSIA